MMPGIERLKEIWLLGNGRVMTESTEGGEGGRDGGWRLEGWHHPDGIRGEDEDSLKVPLVCVRRRHERRRANDYVEKRMKHKGNEEEGEEGKTQTRRESALNNSTFLGFRMYSYERRRREEFGERTALATTWPCLGPFPFPFCAYFRETSASSGCSIGTRPRVSTTIRLPDIVYSSPSPLPCRAALCLQYLNYPLCVCRLASSPVEGGRRQTPPPPPSTAAGPSL
jgi:hypothetical protein